MSITYTLKELEVKIYTKTQIQVRVLAILKEKNKSKSFTLHVSSLNNLPDEELFTTVEFNNHVDKLVSETMFYNSYKDINPFE